MTAPFGRVIDAPWKVPGAETSAFFNYNLTPARWRAYIRDVQQAHAEMRMQGRIQLFEPPAAAARDPDMPAELAAALGSKVSKSMHVTLALAGVVNAYLELHTRSAEGLLTCCPA
jgi:Fip1 motif